MSKRDFVVRFLVALVILGLWLSLMTVALSVKDQPRLPETTLLKTDRSVTCR